MFVYILSGMEGSVGDGTGTRRTLSYTVADTLMERLTGSCSDYVVRSFPDKQAKVGGLMDVAVVIDGAAVCSNEHRYEPHNFIGHPIIFGRLDNVTRHDEFHWVHSYIY